MSGAEVKLDLSRVVFIGRTFEEYRSMFSLSEEELRGRRILDCPAGACSFTAIASQKGAEVTAADIAYHHPFEQLVDKGLQDIEHAMLSMEKARSNYLWDYFGSVEGLKQHRIQALADFSAHVKENPERYVPAVLPELPFKDGEFELTLSAHFLFMYGDRFDYEFHQQTLQELLRVTSGEVRIYPLIDLSSRRYEHLDKLTAFLQSQGYHTEEVEVQYEFQKGADRMLVIKKDN
ncbi:SAM-dependent methyltransferase [Paenibacillus pinistramenti]|uniref:SAM-dependent methyltransferase n=1 Tax=Paenibacillus pinistramenti TaxID=1768003 RepID=UPI001109E63A|nr:SAM-dependent methyltransferase [Paenibacillus pinistramenti]